MQCAAIPVLWEKIEVRLLREVDLPRRRGAARVMVGVAVAATFFKLRDGRLQLTKGRREPTMRLAQNRLRRD